MTDSYPEKHNGAAIAAAKECFKEAGHNLKEAGQILSHETRERVELAMDQAKKHSTEIKDAVSNYVRENPGKSLGWSLLAGVTLGLLLRR